MSKVRIELNTEAVGSLLKSKSMKNMLSDIASDIAGRAGDGYSSDTKVLNTRVVASAYTATTDAMRDNSENNTLLGALR